MARFQSTARWELDRTSDGQAHKAAYAHVGIRLHAWNHTQPSHTAAVAGRVGDRCSSPIPQVAVSCPRPREESSFALGACAADKQNHPRKMLDWAEGGFLFNVIYPETTSRSSSSKRRRSQTIQADIPVLLLQLVLWIRPTKSASYYPAISLHQGRIIPLAQPDIKRQPIRSEVTSESWKKNGFPSLLFWIWRRRLL